MQGALSFGGVCRRQHCSKARHACYDTEHPGCTRLAKITRLNLPASFSHTLCDPCYREGVPVCMCLAECLEEASKKLRCPELPHVCSGNSSWRPTGVDWEFACSTGGRLISRGRGTLVQERPDLADQWDHELNGDMAPENVQAGSAYRATWRCGMCCIHCERPHVWQATVARRTKAQGTNCPVCSGLKVCSCQSLAMLRPDLMVDWHVENPLDPQTLGCSSTQKALWTCSKRPEHGSWPAAIGDRARPKTTGCPRCATEALRRPRNARGLLKEEFPEVYAQIHPIPWSLGFLEGLTSGSNRKVWWRCTETQNRPPGCPHEHVWEAKVSQRCNHKTGCPFCYGRFVCPCNSMAEKASGMLVVWHYDRNKEVGPEQVGIYSHRKFWWRHICPTTGEEHEGQAAMYNSYTAYMQDEKLGKGGYRIPCPICWKRARKQLSIDAKQARKSLSAT